MVGNLSSKLSSVPHISHCMALESTTVLWAQLSPAPKKWAELLGERHDELATKRGHLSCTPALYTLSLGLATLLGVSMNIWHHSWQDLDGEQGGDVAHHVHAS